MAFWPLGFPVPKTGWWSQYDPLNMKKVDKPWGWYIVLDEGPDYVIKKIYISPLERFSLQRHLYREEYWHILTGYGLINIDSKKKVVYENESFHIKNDTIHRLQSGKDGITFIEVQRGKCDENDIIRLEDDYNRVDKSILTGFLFPEKE